LYAEQNKVFNLVLTNDETFVLCSTKSTNCIFDAVISLNKDHHILNYAL